MSHALSRFDPVARMFRTDPFRSFEEMFSDLRLPAALRAADLTPRVRIDVTETGEGYKVRADLPGVKKDDIKVNIEGNQVSISAETKSHSEHEGANMICAERSSGQYYRSFTLPQAVDDGGAKASFHDGVLELDLPKKASGGGKSLKIG